MDNKLKNIESHYEREEGVHLLKHSLIDVQSVDLSANSNLENDAKDISGALLWA